MVVTGISDVRLGEKDEEVYQARANLEPARSREPLKLQSELNELCIEDGSSEKALSKALEIDAPSRATSQSESKNAKSDLATRFKQIVVEHLGVPDHKVFGYSHLVDDLGADSLDSVELMMAFEAEADVDFPDHVYHEIQTLDDAIKVAKNAIAYRDVAKRVKNIVLEHLGVSRDAMTNDADLIDDLGADSLDTVELTTAFEEEFQIRIANWYHTTTLGDLIRSIHTQLLQSTS